MPVALMVELTRYLAAHPLVRRLIQVAAKITQRLIDLFAEVGGRQVGVIHLGDCAACLVSAGSTGSLRCRRWSR